MPLSTHRDESSVAGPPRSGGLFRVVKPMHMAASAVSETRVSSAVRPLAVDVRDVSLTYEAADGEVAALSGVNLGIAEGEFVSFIGPSGCGKTTLLRLIADLEQPTAGALLVNGMSAGQARLTRAYGYIFQAPALYPWRTIEKNVMLPLEVMGYSHRERRERATRYLALVNLSGFERKFPWQLSGGMQQRASIARALSFDPALLLMDEPFGALDEIVRDHLNEQLLRDRDFRDPFDSGGDIPVHQDRRHVAASGSHHRCHRVRSSPRAHAGNPRNSAIRQECPAGSHGPSFRSFL